MRWPSISLTKWRAGIAAAAERFPYAILCGGIAAGCAIVGTHRSSDQTIVGQCERLAMTVALGLRLFFSLRILRERVARFRRFPLELLGIALLAWWFFAHSARPADEPQMVFIRWALLLAALHFFAAISPYLRSAEGPGFWQFNRHLFFALRPNDALYRRAYGRAGACTSECR